jgi:hypothetical protein
MMPALALSLTVRAVHGLGWLRSASDTSTSGLSEWTCWAWAWALMKRLLGMQEAAAYRYY